MLTLKHIIYTNCVKSAHELISKKQSRETLVTYHSLLTNVVPWPQLLCTLYTQRIFAQCLLQRISKVVAIYKLKIA